MLTRFHSAVLPLIAALLIPIFYFSAQSGAEVLEEPSAQVATAEEVEAQDMLAASWTHVGCIQLGSTCYDVFQDPGGTLWVCKECFKTKKPSPGKCRKLTSEEIQNSPWCA